MVTICQLEQFVCPSVSMSSSFCRTEKEMKTTRSNDTDKEEFSFNYFLIAVHCMIANALGLLLPFLFAMQLGLKNIYMHMIIIFGFSLMRFIAVYIRYYHLPITKGPKQLKKRRWCQVSAYRCTHSHDYLIIIIPSFSVQ